MFDWNEEELTNIIWGEAGESDDHIVPYPNQIEEKPSILYGDPPKKETKQQTSNTSPPKQKNSPTKAEYGIGLESNSKYDSGEPARGFDHASWSDGPDPSSSNVTIDETSQIKKDPEMFEDKPEDDEQSDFVDYDWANIGSFYDLDRIFSNQIPIFGDMSVGHTDVWPPSKDVTSSCFDTTPFSGDSCDMPFGALRTSTDQSEVKAEYIIDTGQPFTSQDVQASSEIIEYFGGKSNLLGKEKIPAMGGRTKACSTQLNDGTAATATEFPGKDIRQTRLLKGQKLIKKSNARQLHNLSDTRTSTGSTLQQHNSHYVPSMVNQRPPLVLTQQSSLPRPEPFQQKFFPDAPLGTPVYGTMVNCYPSTSVQPQFHPGAGDENHELTMSSSCEAQPFSSSSRKNLEEAAAKPLAMTPREKVEKLRRRQQMRAILAIQKQQLQFVNQVLVSEHPDMEGGRNDPSLEPSSPPKVYDSNTISMAFDNCSVEESVLHRLQDTIDKLDIRMRLCIRDSLFRLAQSAVQRLYHNGMGSHSTSSRDEEVPSNRDIVGHHERFTTMGDMETDTNPIDRTVAHLLFHRPVEFSEKPADAPDSPSSPNLAYENKANPSESLAKAESFLNTQITSPQGSKTAGLFSDGNGPAFVTSNTEITDAVQVKGETSS